MVKWDRLFFGEKVIQSKEHCSISVVDEPGGQTKADRSTKDHSPVAQLFLYDNDLLHMPVCLPLYLLTIFGGVAKADASNITQVLGRKLKVICASAEKKQEKNMFKSSYELM